MFNGYGPARLGRDVEVNTTPSGQAVANLSLAFDIRVKGEKHTQWVKASLWGKRAEVLEQYLLKGTRVMVSLQNVRIDTFTKSDGSTATSLAAEISDIDLIGDMPQRQEAAPPPARRPPPAPAPAQRQARAPAPSEFSDMDDDSDIPF